MTCNKKAERAGKTPEQFADEILRDVRPTRRTDRQLRDIAYTAASTMALKVVQGAADYGEKVESIVSARRSVAAASTRPSMSSTRLGKNRRVRFGLRLEKGIRGKVE